MIYYICSGGVSPYSRNFVPPVPPVPPVPEQVRRLEGWKVGSLEGWKVRIVEDFPYSKAWRARRLEIGRFNGWKAGRFKGFCHFPFRDTLGLSRGARQVCNCFIRATIPSRPLSVARA